MALAVLLEGWYVLYVLTDHFALPGPGRWGEVVMKPQHCRNIEDLSSSHASDRAFSPPHPLNQRAGERSLANYYRWRHFLLNGHRRHVGRSERHFQTELRREFQSGDSFW